MELVGRMALVPSIKVGLINIMRGKGEMRGGSHQYYEREG